MAGGDEEASGEAVVLVVVRCEGHGAYLDLSTGGGQMS
jgi:hypothetical protein